MQDQKKNEQKELQNLLNSYVSVLTNKLGRTPTIEEVNQALSEGNAQNSEQKPDQNLDQLSQSAMTDIPPSSDEPKILKMKVYYGMSKSDTGQFTYDPYQILYYENGDNGEVYDVGNKDWTSDRPGMMDHLQSRDINFEEKDILYAMIHGILDDDDYSKLDSKGMITPVAKSVWDKIQKIHSDMGKLESLEKSDENPDDQIEEDKNVQDLEIKEESDIDDQVEEVIGDDLVSQIMQACMQKVSESVIDENYIRQIVRDEIKQMANSGNYDDDDDNDMMD